MIKLLFSILLLLVSVLVYTSGTLPKYRFFLDDESTNTLSTGASTLATTTTTSSGTQVSIVNEGEAEWQVSPYTLYSNKEPNSFESANRRYRAILQADCNFVVYDGSVALWSSNSASNSRPCTLSLQADGNFVLRSASNQVLFKTDTMWKGQGPWAARLKNDGNFVIQDKYEQLTWHTDTASYADTLRSSRSISSQDSRNYLQSQNGVYKAVIQSDCNFVLYMGANAVWKSNTARTGPCNLAMQGDGNLVIYAGNSAVWSTNTAGKGAGPYRLVMQSDRNLVIYDNTGKALWTSNTASAFNPTRIKLSNARYDLSEVNNIEKAPNSVAMVQCTNEDSSEQMHCEQELSYTDTEESNWSTSFSLSVSVAVEMDVSFFGMGGGVSVTTTTTWDWQHGGSSSKAISGLARVAADVPPRKRVQFEVLSRKSQISIPYSALATAYFADGNFVTFEFNGRYTGVQSAGFEVVKKPAVAI